MKNSPVSCDWLRERPWSMALLWILPAALLPAVPIDETRYLSVAWEMHRTGDLIGLTLNGQPYMDKSPLLFWLINLAWLALGVSTLAARLVCVTFAAGAVATVAAVARHLELRRPALVGWMLLPFAVFGAFSPAVMFDVPLLYFVTLGFFGLVQWLRGRKRRGALVFFLAAVCGLLAKGPVYLVHVAGPLLLIRWWHGKPIEHPVRLGLELAGCLLLACVPLAVWAVFNAARIQGVPVLETLTHQSVGRVAESFAHRRNPFWYLLWLLPFLLPWSLLIRWRQVPANMRRAAGDAGGRFGIAACLPAFLAFSAISGKQVHYLLPLLPGVALLLGAMYQHGAGLFAYRRVRVLLLLAIAAGLWLVVEALAGAHGSRTWYVAAVLSAGLLSSGILMTRALGRYDDDECLRRSSLAALLAFMSGVLLVGAHVGTHMEPMELAAAVKALQREGAIIAVVDDEPGMINYLARLPRPLPLIVDSAQWARAHPHGYALVHASHGKVPAFVDAPIELTDGWEGLVPAPDLHEVHP